jgi:hypothetical protein
MVYHANLPGHGAYSTCYEAAYMAGNIDLRPTLPIVVFRDPYPITRVHSRVTGFTFSVPTVKSYMSLRLYRLSCPYTLNA